MKVLSSEWQHRTLFVLVMILQVIRVIFLEWHFWLIPVFLWPCVLALMVLNHLLLNGVLKFLIVQCILALSSVISSVVFTVRYCNVISDDPLAGVVGYLIAILELGIIGITTVVLTLVKYFEKRKK